MTRCVDGGSHPQLWFRWNDAYWWCPACHLVVDDAIGSTAITTCGYFDDKCQLFDTPPHLGDTEARA